jgi:hypothetical protein
LKGPEYKIQFNRERKATGGVIKLAPPLLRNNTWPASTPVLVKRRSTRGREKDVAGLIDILFGSTDGDDSDEADDMDDMDDNRASI